MLYDELAASIIAIAAENPDGFTVHVGTLELITSGIAVGHAATQHCYQLAGLHTAMQHAIYNYGYLGGWRNQNGEMQYDSIRMFKDLRSAIRWGRKQKQIAIFDIDNGWEIIL